MTNVLTDDADIERQVQKLHVCTGKLKPAQISHVQLGCQDDTVLFILFAPIHSTAMVEPQEILHEQTLCDIPQPAEDVPGSAQVREHQSTMCSFRCPVLPSSYKETCT